MKTGINGQNVLLITGGKHMQKPKKKLLDVVRDKIRVKHYSLSTERTYIHWIKHYIFYHNKKHPIEMAKPEIEAFSPHRIISL